MQIKATMIYNFIPTYCQKFESPIISSCQDVITADYINHFSSKTEMCISCNPVVLLLDVLPGETCMCA